MTNRVFNFYAGPATLPLPILEKAKEEFLDFKGTGMSVMEISHRSKQYDETHNEAIALIKELMNIPDDYKIMWLPGGASTQFYQMPLNLKQEGKPFEYVNTGVWSKKAIAEAKFYGDVNVIASSEDKTFNYIPKDVAFNEGSAMAHITGNNTIYGTEWHYWPKVPSDVPLCCDVSSHIMDREIDVKKFGVIYGGAQKNLGPSGIAICIVREDLLDRVDPNTPTMQKWSTHAKANSLFNTCPVMPIYMCGLALQYNKSLGGVAAIEETNRKKAKILYDAMDNSGGFYTGFAEKESRSLMNITFNLPTPELEAKCVVEGLENGLVGLKGHRSIGGMRASIYNAMPTEGVQALVDFMKEFQENNQ